MGTRNTVSRILLLVVPFLAGCSSSTRDVPVTVEVTREVPATVEVTTVVEVTSEPVAAVTEATIPWTEVRTLHSSAVGRDYRISVALPLSYSSNTSKTYPVVYLLDGDLLFGVVSEPTRFLQWAEELPELIIVGIGYGALWDNRYELLRLREIDLTPTNISTTPGSGGAAEFLKFIQENLIPHIDANYRTDPTDRTIVGYSHGGLFSLYALFHAPETFNRYITSSPSLLWDDRVTFEYEEEFAKSHSDLPVKLFLSVGGLEGSWVSDLEEFHKRLDDRNYAGLEMEMVVMEGETHASGFPGALSRGFRSVFP